MTRPKAALGPPGVVVPRSRARAPEVHPTVGVDAHARDLVHAGGVIAVRFGVFAQPATPRHAWSARSDAHS